MLVGKNLPQIPNDPMIRSRIYVKTEIEQHPLLQAAIGHEWSYAGGFSLATTQTPASASAGSFGVNHAKLHAEVERTKQRHRFTLEAAQSGMLEIGSQAFNARFPLGTVVTRGAIGDAMIEGLPVKLLVREGDKLVEVEGTQRGSKRLDAMMDSLVLDVGGKTREIPYDKIEVAFAADPYQHYSDAARARGLKDAGALTPEQLTALDGKQAVVIAKTRDWVAYDQQDKRPIKSFEGTIEAQEKPGQFKLKGIEGFFNLSELGSERVFVN